MREAQQVSAVKQSSFYENEPTGGAIHGRSIMSSFALWLLTR